MNLLLDTSVLIDFLGRKEPFFDAAQRVVAAGFFGDVNLWTPVQSLKDAFYVLEHYVDSHAVQQAMRLRDAFVSKGYKMYSNSPTKQQFVLLDNDTIQLLEKDFVFEQWFPVGDMMNCRFVTSWATLPGDVDALIDALPVSK